MQHEATILVHRSPAQHRQVRRTPVGRLDFHLLEHFAERHGQRTVEHDAERAFFAVLADERHRLREVRIGELGIAISK